MYVQDLTKSLLDATSNTNVARVRDLLARGVDPNAIGACRRTALPVAVQNANNNEVDAILIAELLLAAGADVNASPGICLSPIRLAAIHGYVDLLRFLIAAGADVNDRDSVGETVISMLETTPCLKRCRRRVVKILEKAGGVRAGAAAESTA